MAPKTPLRRQLLYTFGILFGGGILVASVSLALALPNLNTLGKSRCMSWYCSLPSWR